MAIKITGSVQNYRVGRVSGNTPIIFGLTVISWLPAPLVKQLAGPVATTINNTLSVLTHFY